MPQLLDIGFLKSLDLDPGEHDLPQALDGGFPVESETMWGDE